MPPQPPSPPAPQRPGSPAPRPPAWWAPGRDPRPFSLRELAAWIVLLAWLWISRWTVAPDVLYEWDSANYALGIRDGFDIHLHQPHPPGYPLYTLLLWGLSKMSVSETWPFLAANSLFGGATLVLLGWMLRRSAGPALTLAVVTAFSVCPPLWFQGAVTTAYVTECFCSVACMSLALALARGRLDVRWSALVFAVILGIRPSGVLSFSPVILLAGALRWPGWRRVAQALGLFGLACTAWFVPLVLLGGGCERYWEATSALYRWQRMTSQMTTSLWNITALLRYLVDSINLLWLALALNLVLVALTQRASRRTAALLGVWFLPAAAIYTFHHLAKSAYVLTLVPVGFVATGLALGAALPHLRRRWRLVALAANGVLLAAYLVLNIGAFYGAVPRLLHRYADARIELPERVLLLGDYGRLGLRYRTYAKQRMRKILQQLDPQQDLAFFTFGALELHRIAGYYYPRQWRVATSMGHGLVLRNPVGPGDLDFGAFQMRVLRPGPHRTRRPRAVCIHAEPGRLLLTRGSTELEVALPRVPRRLVVFFAAPVSRLWRGGGMQPVRRHHVGAGFMAWELDPAGARARQRPRLTPLQRFRRCRRPVAVNPTALEISSK